MSDVNQDLPELNRNDDSYSDPAIVRRDWEGRQTDWLLQWFVRWINETSTTIGVTLTVGGTQIAGDLISHTSYFTKLADGFSNSFREFKTVDPEDVKQMIQSFNVPSSVPDGEVPPPYQYLHLSNVAVSSAGTTLVLQNGLWRGKVSAVEGFMLGRTSI